MRCDCDEKLVNTKFQQSESTEKCPKIHLPTNSSTIIIILISIYLIRSRSIAKKVAEMMTNMLSALMYPHAYPLLVADDFSLADIFKSK